MNKKALSLAVYIAISYPSATLALGLGEIESVSNLNQPFKAKIDLLSVGKTNVRNLKVKVASPSVFSRVGIDRPNFLNGLRFRSAVENGKPVILVSSSQPVKEPFINFLLEVSWPKGQLLKEYTVLLDPPVLMQPGTSVASNTAGVRPDPSKATQAQAQVQQQNANQQAAQAQQRQRVIAQQQQTRQQQLQRQRQQQLNQQRAQNDSLRRPTTPTSQGAANSQSRTYRIRRGDTLYKVAQKLGYQGVRNEQMMMAIFETNPTAFRKRNINNLKSGVTVRRPSINEAKRISLSTARKDIRSQTTEWRSAKPKKPVQTANNAQGNTGKATEKAAPAASQARIEVIGSDGKSSANSGNLTGQAKLDDLNRQMTLASESLTARTRENNELKSRVSELEALLKKKNRLITLKNEQLAELQVSLDKPATATTAEGTDIVDTVVDAQGEDIEKALAGQEGTDGTIVRTDPVNPIITDDLTQDTEITQEPVTNDITPVVDPQPPVEEDGGILGLLSSPLVMGLGGGSLLALIAGFLFLRRRNNNEEYDDYSSIDFDDPEFAPGSSSFDENPSSQDPISDADDPFAGLDESPTKAESSFDVDPMDEMIQEEAPKVTTSTMPAAAPVAKATSDVDDEDDILQEADVYIVYGLHEQAEVELKKAIEKQPDNLEYRAKLLENYHASDNKEAFKASAAEFAQLEGPGKDKLWEKVSDWGGKLLPGSPLFASPSVAAVTSEAIAQPDEKGSDMLGKAGLAAAVGGIAITAGKAYAENAQDELTDTLSDAKGSADSKISDLADEVPSFGETEDQQSAEVLDFDDMDLDSLLSADSDDTEITSLESPDGLDVSFESLETSDEVQAGFETLDLDNMIEGMSDDADAKSEAESVEDSDGMDFDFSDFEIDDDAISELNEDVGLISTNLNLELDGSDNGVGKILPENSVYKLSETKEPKDDILGAMDDDLSFLDLEDDTDTNLLEAQVSTKLDLARAYMDMGDVEGARSTLEEVMTEGSDDQKKEAKALLQQAG